MKKFVYTLMLGTTLAFFGCGGDGGPVSSTPVPAVVESEPAYATALRPLLEQHLRDTLSPGLIVMVRSAELGDWNATFGTTTYGGSTPISLTDQTRIGSVTKTMTGTVILQLVAEGRIRLSDPISLYLPQVPNGQNITIEMMLDMRSGLYNYTLDPGFNEELDANPQRVWTRDELLAIAFSHDPFFPPDEGYAYSNTNTLLLGLLIEQQTGLPYEEAFRQRIFEPLGMSHTLAVVPQDNTIPLPYANGYQFGTNVETLDSPVLPIEQQEAAFSGALAPTDWTLANPSWTSSAGSGISTAADLVIYVRALVGGGLLPPALQQARLASQRKTSPDAPEAAPTYGWALARFGALYGHTGELPGYNTFVGHDPVRGITVVVLANLNAAPDGSSVANTAAMIIIDQLYGTPAAPPLDDGEGPLE